ncbi:MAG: UbiX family flavin prenyltransferase [Synechococcus lacustris]
MKKRLIVGITGASGTIYGVRLLEILREIGGIETHLITSKAVERTTSEEGGRPIKEIKALADVVHDEQDIGASIASGSFRTMGMIVAPCSVKTMSSIANCITGSLMTRAADVVLKERRRLVLMFRETPFHLGHLRNLTALTEMGAIIAPPIPSFYHQPQTVGDIVDQSVRRVLDLFDLDVPGIKRWKETLSKSDP